MAIKIKKKKKLVIKKKRPLILSDEEIEKRKRISVALWAYAYEIMDAPMVSDAKFDSVCESINLDIKTGNKKLDKWFEANFKPHTGLWVHKHPEYDKLEKLWIRLNEHKDQ